MSQSHAPTTTEDTRPILFFDIDNCLYPRSKQVQEHMQALIDRYFATHLGLSEADAVALHKKYYTEYGLALAGLVKHHKIDPLEYNKLVDDALPLDEILDRDEGLVNLLDGIDKSRVKLWLFTNAYFTHAERVVKLLGVGEFFEGVTYCDYSRMPLVAKPHAEMFEKAGREAGSLQGVGVRECYFVDDSGLNCRAAAERGWKVVQKIEEEDREPRGNWRGVRRLEELRGIWPQFFKEEKEGGGVVENGVVEGGDGREAEKEKL